jgi:hypothetical protein
MSRSWIALALLVGCGTTHSPETDGGTDARGIVDGGTDAFLDPSQVGQVATSCGAADQGLTPIDCIAHGDTMAFCVFGNHCSCSTGFVCERPGFVAPECDAGASCVPTP